MTIDSAAVVVSVFVDEVVELVSLVVSVSVDVGEVSEDWPDAAVEDISGAEPVAVLASSLGSDAAALVKRSPKLLANRSGAGSDSATGQTSPCGVLEASKMVLVSADVVSAVDDVTVFAVVDEDVEVATEDWSEAGDAEGSEEVSVAAVSPGGSDLTALVKKSAKLLP